VTSILETLDLFRSAFIGSLLVALACSILGVLVVGRRMVLVGVALPQVAAAGIGVSFLAAMVTWTAPGTWFEPLRHHATMAVLFCVVALLLLVRSPGSRRSGSEVTTGAVFAFSGALAVLAVQASAEGMEELRHLVEGEILAIHGSSLPGLFAVLGSVLALQVVLNRRLVFIAFDPEMAATLGIRVRLHEVLFHACLAVGVAKSVHTAGTLFVFAYLLLPAATGLLLARSVAGVFLVAGSTGVFAAAAGFLIAADERVDWPVGPTATVAVVAVFLLANSYVALRETPSHSR
jgi:ABC-type Mn2+/Zn2+ transport system permease subunit